MAWGLVVSSRNHHHDQSGRQSRHRDVAVGNHGGDNRPLDHADFDYLFD